MYQVEKKQLVPFGSETAPLKHKVNFAGCKLLLAVFTVDSAASGQKRDQS